MGSPKRFLKWILAVAVLGLLLASHHLWLAALGGSLVRSEHPVQADIAVVLAGDGYGHRLLRGAGLVRDGYAPQVLVSGPPGYYGVHECDLAVPFAVKRGYPESWFVRFPNGALSTLEEARFILPELRRRGVRKFLLVTSDYHTRRARLIFRRMAPDMEFRVIAAPDEHFRPGDWWLSRQGRKICALEWLKTLSAWFGV